MKISSCPLPGVFAVDALRQNARRTGCAVHEPAERAVDLSGVARQLSALGSEGQDVDLQKVQALRDAIARGQLQMDACRIADGLIASAQELLRQDR